MKYIKFPVKDRDILKIQRKNFIDISVFGPENKKKYPMYVSKKSYKDKLVNFLLIEEGGKTYYILIKYFNTFMYDYTLHRGRKYLCR